MNTLATKPEGDLVQTDISFRELLDLLRRGKWYVAALVIFVAGVAGASGVLLPKKYQATVIISPTSSNSDLGRLGGLSNLASQLGGLGSVAGVSLSEGSKKWESLAILQSDALIGKYIEDHNLLPVLYADAWDARAKKWKPDEETPTTWDATQYFKKRVLSVASDNKTGLVTLTISWLDPSTVAGWANDLVKETNNRLRNRAISESERNIAYLRAEAQTTDMVGVKQAIYDIMQSEISKVMLARGNEDFALKVLDPAITPERSISKTPLQRTVIGGLLGLFISVFSAFALLLWKRT